MSHIMSHVVSLLYRLLNYVLQLTSLVGRCVHMCLQSSEVVVDDDNVNCIVH